MGDNSAILGVGSRVWGSSNFVIGNKSKSSGENNLVFGSDTNIGDRILNSIAIGKMLS